MKCINESKKFHSQQISAKIDNFPQRIFLYDTPVNILIKTYFYPIPLFLYFAYFLPVSGCGTIEIAYFFPIFKILLMDVEKLLPKKLTVAWRSAWHTTKSPLSISF